jgi:DNA-binding CsgD family transcriptional regulator
LDRPASDPESRWARRLALSDYAERIAGVGCWEWTLESEEILWSDNLFRIFGLEPGPVAPTPDFVVSRVHADDRGRVQELERTLRTGRPTDRGVEYRIVHDDGTIRTLRATVAVASDGPASDPRRLVGLIQDVTLARRLDRQLAAHVAVTQALDEWTSLETGAKGLLSGLADALELAFATFWVPDGSDLAATVVWHLPFDALESVAETTRAWRPGRGSATVGRAFVGRRPILASDASAGSPPARTAAIRHAGLGGALIVPAVDGDDTLAVCEFLLFEPPEPTERLVRVLKGIGSEIGHFLSHRSGEMTVPVLTPRELAVLQLAAQAYSAARIAEQLHVSPATVKRHFERAYAALGVSDRAAAVGEAMRRGLVT